MKHEAALGSLLTALQGAGLRVGIGEVERLRCVFARLGDETPTARSGHDDPERSDAARLRALVAAVVVKSQRERATFDTQFDAWLARQSFEVARAPDARPEVADDPGVAPERRTPQRTRWRPWVASALAGVLGLLLAQHADYGRVAPASTPTPAFTPVPKPTRAAGPQAPARPGHTPTPSPRLSPRERRFEAIVPVLHVVPGRMQWMGTGWLALALTALVTAVVLVVVTRRRRWLPVAPPLAHREGPARVPLSAKAAGLELLLPREQEALVWGVGHFVSDKPTRRLDLPATVKATAHAAGLVRPRFLAARHPHEVWLWLDEATPDPALPRLADEVQHLLRRHGLPVATARFFELPARLVGDDGRAFAPGELDERRDTALVALLTDGRGLRRELESGARRAQASALLRQLSFWPRVRVVDFSPQADVQALLAAHDIALDVIGPADLAAFLGADGADRGGPAFAIGAPRGDVALWAGACALWPSEVSEDAALRLRRALGLRASPWELRVLHADGGVFTRHLRWEGARRARYINRLHAAEASGSGLASGGLLARALDFWLEESAAEEQRQAASGRPWQDTPAEQRVRAERALLRLWREPAAAARELFALYQGDLRALIRRALAQHAPADRVAGERIRLPWTWTGLGAAERVLLQAMGLGGELGPVRLRQPGRVAAGVAALLAIAALGGVQAWQAPRWPKVEQHGMPEDGVVVAPVRVGDGWRLEASTRRFSASRTFAAGNVQVEWRRETRRCVETEAATGVGSVEVWRCGQFAPRPSLLKDIERSVAVLLDPPTVAEGEATAAALLDGGTADVVWVGHGMGKQSVSGVEDLMWHAHVTNMQWLVVAPRAVVPDLSRVAPRPHFGTGLPHRAWVSTDDWLSLRARLPLEGETALEQAWPGVVATPASVTGVRLTGEGRLRDVAFETVTLDRKGTVVDRPRGSARVFTEDLGNGVGLDMVLVPGGSFTMGSPTSEEGRYPDEGPQHDVSVSPFALGRLEITQAQWRAVAAWPQVRMPLAADPSFLKGSARPVEQVSWHEAQEFCTRLTARTGRQYRLPSEAEWEYAARAGTTTPFAFGETITPDLVNYNGNYPYAAAPRGSYRERTSDAGSLGVPNAWGLFDMHGNVFEWVQDAWHDNYAGAPTDSRAWQGGPASERVTRGGSWFTYADYCRSAYRAHPEPGKRGINIGFRVLCVLSRTP